MTNERRRVLRFRKMQALGNDFVVLDGVSQHIELSPAQRSHIADRRFGIGCDQILLLQPTENDDCDFRYRIFNADGNEVEQCGNGARCVARFARDIGLTAKQELCFETQAGVITATLQPDGQVTVNMGVPRFEPESVPFLTEAFQPTYALKIGTALRQFSVLSMGNPHAVQIVSSVERAPVAEEGPLIEKHAQFPNGANAGFVEILDRKHAKVRVFERGVGETLACGTGACAAAVAGIELGLLDREVAMHTRGGELKVRWDGREQPVWMTGPAATVFVGEIEI